MEHIYVGKIVNTHGIKGEVRIQSDFERKDRLFCLGNELLIGGGSYRIASYRVHKNYDMVTFVGFNDINQVLPLKGQKVYVERSQLKLKENDILLADLIDKPVYYAGNMLGKVEDYELGANPLLIIKTPEKKKIYIPLRGNFIAEMSLKGLTLAEEARGLL